MVQAAPDPTIWGNKTVTKVSARPISGDAERHKASEDRDTSTISSLHGTVDRRDSTSLQELSHASGIIMDDIGGDQCFNSSDDLCEHKRMPTPKAERSNGEPNIQQCSRFPPRLEAEQDSLVTVSSELMFRIFRSKLT